MLQAAHRNCSPGASGNPRTGLKTGHYMRSAARLSPWQAQGKKDGPNISFEPSTRHPVKDAHPERAARVEGSLRPAPQVHPGGRRPASRGSWLSTVGYELSFSPKCFVSPCPPRPDLRGERSLRWAHTRALLSPTIPAHPSHSPVSPIIPAHTKNRGVGA